MVVIGSGDFFMVDDGEVVVGKGVVVGEGVVVIGEGVVVIGEGLVVIGEGVVVICEGVVVDGIVGTDEGVEVKDIELFVTFLITCEEL